VVVIRIGSTDLIRNGSMMVFIACCFLPGPFSPASNLRPALTGPRPLRNVDRQRRNA
jgi:hypothetical protein